MNRPEIQEILSKTSKTRFRLAGFAFAGRKSNPLGCDERFLSHCDFILSRASPGAIRIPDRMFGRKLRTIAWDDTAGAVSGDYFGIEELQEAIRR